MTWAKNLAFISRIFGFPLSPPPPNSLSHHLLYLFFSVYLIPLFALILSRSFSLSHPPLMYYSLILYHFFSPSPSCTILLFISLSLYFLLSLSLNLHLSPSIFSSLSQPLAPSLLLSQTLYFLLSLPLLHHLFFPLPPIPVTNSVKTSQFACVSKRKPRSH